MTRPAEPERHDPRVGTSNPHASLWQVDEPYLGPPEAGQPRAGSAGRPVARRGEAATPDLQRAPPAAA